MERDPYGMVVENVARGLSAEVQLEPLLRKVLRTIQVNVPFLQDLRFAIQRAYRKLNEIVYEPDFDALRLIPWVNNSTAIDIGANRGDTIQAIQMRTRNVKVMAFEPNPLIFSRLHRVYKGNPNVKLFNFGLGDKDEIVSLNIPFYKDFMFDGLASFKAEAALRWLRDRIFFYDDKHLRLRRIDCCLTQLDKFKLQPSFIKVDVQGFEHQVLSGAKDTLNASRPVVLIETPDYETRQLMNGLGFVPYRYRDNRLAPGFGDLNTFYFPSEKANAIAR